MSRFGWILTWNNCGIRIVSDMVRAEGDEKNYHAGLDLQRLIKKTHGFSSSLLIFCMKTGKATSIARQQNADAELINSITARF
jgi:hypothetical protein